MGKRREASVSWCVRAFLCARARHARHGIDSLCVFVVHHAALAGKRSDGRPIDKVHATTSRKRVTPRAEKSFLTTCVALRRSREGADEQAASRAARRSGRTGSKQRASCAGGPPAAGRRRRDTAHVCSIAAPTRERARPGARQRSARRADRRSRTSNLLVVKLQEQQVERTSTPVARSATSHKPQARRRSHRAPRATNFEEPQDMRVSGAPEPGPSRARHGCGARRGRTCGERARCVGSHRRPLVRAMLGRLCFHPGPSPPGPLAATILGSRCLSNGVRDDGLHVVHAAASSGFFSITFATRCACRFSWIFTSLGTSGMPHLQAEHRAARARIGSR